MAARKSVTAISVSALIADLKDPQRSEVETLRALILGVAKGVGEEVKWNSPSFHTGEHFATMRLNGKILLQLILHLGVKKSALARDAIDDPEGLLQWLGPDRACINMAEAGFVARHAESIRSIVGQWVQHVPPLTSD
ncbi:MAG: DUF1801 domain-containing protein [Xanthomonadales bacterium]|nr:DUF1801 domain-containing protein [Xanthomonadales bacterium]MCB1635091.1 DUF1801 domain-containing protein [Xanthomonadales bacterium]